MPTRTSPTGQYGRGVGVTDVTRKPAGFQTIADVSTVTGLTIPAGGASVALIQVLVGDANWRDDGVDPVNDIGGGFQLAELDSFLYTGDLTAIKFIEVTSGTTATVNIVYYR
jgi:hypothetical protein